MKKLLVLLLLPLSVSAWDFTQERNTIPVYFDSVQCHVPWTTGYNYVNPTFADIDNDNDYDLFIGSDWARVTLVKNNGNSITPHFLFISDSIVSLPETSPASQIPARPSLCDIDGDSDLDLIVGYQLNYPVTDGRLFCYRNIGSSTNPILQYYDGWFQNIDVYGDKYITFIDIDDDNDYDLFIGFGVILTSRAGKIYYYRNDGTSQTPDMVLVSDYFLNIDLGDYCIPSFTDIDADGDYDMFLGDENGNIHYFRNDSTPQHYNFVFVSQQYQGINVGRIASPAFCDIDGDGDYDLFVGERSWGEDNRHGDIDFYENVGRPDSAVFRLVTQNFIGIDIGLTPYPSFADINYDGLKDMFLGDSDGNINYFSNIGTSGNPIFSLTEERFQNITANYQSRPSFGDLDGDGDLDLLVGRVYYNTGSVHLYRNNGTSQSPEYRLISSNYLGINYEWPAPRLADIDADGDLDLFVGHSDNQVVFWENVGTPQNPEFTLVDTNYLNTPNQNNLFCPICFGDLDNDGDLDILRGHRDSGPPSYVGSYLSYYRNDGTPTSPNFVLAEPHFLGITLVKYSEPYLEDIDNDGDLDLFVGDGPGGVSFWRNNAISNIVNKPRITPCAFALGQNYPNPFNAVTTIPLTLERALPVRVVVYNQMGQRVETLFEGRMSGGAHLLRWEAGGMASGVYVIRLTTSGNSRAVKTMLMK